MKPSKGYSHFAKHEVELLQKWAKKGKTASEISKLLDRDLSSVARRMKLGVSGPAGSKAGRPRLLGGWVRDGGSVCENTGFPASHFRGPLVFHTWTVVDRESGFRGPLFFHTWTVVDRSF